MRNDSGLDSGFISRNECAEKWVLENNFGSNVQKLIHQVLSCMTEKRSLTKVWGLDKAIWKKMKLFSGADLNHYFRLL